MYLVQIIHDVLAELREFEARHTEWLSLYKGIAISRKTVEDWHRQRIASLDKILVPFAKRAEELGLTTEETDTLITLLHKKLGQEQETSMRVIPQADYIVLQDEIFMLQLQLREAAVAIAAMRAIRKCGEVEVWHIGGLGWKAAATGGVSNRQAADSPEKAILALYDYLVARGDINADLR